MPSLNYIAYQVFLAWNRTRYRIFISHHSRLEGEGRGLESEFTQLAALTPPLPLGIADYVLNYIARDEEKQPLGAELSRASRIVPPGIKASGWNYFLWALTALFQGSRSIFRGAGEMGPEAALVSLLRLRSQLAAKVLRTLDSKSWPPGMDLEGYPAQIWPTLTRTFGLKNSCPNYWFAGDLHWVQRFFAGRALLARDIRTMLTENWQFIPAHLREGWLAGWDPDLASAVWVPKEIRDVFQILALRGEGRLLPSVGRDLRGRLVCYRCGQSSQLRFSICGHCDRPACYYCESCNSMGLARECLPFYALPGLKPTGSNGAGGEKDRGHQAEEVSRAAFVPINLGFELTPAQQRAAEEVRQFVLLSSLNQCLIWAVCGAGKTEVVFPALAEVLTGGGQVLYAIPRRDVVQEIEPRLQQAFPDYRVVGLYAGSQHRFGTADIYVSTTHQTLRFYQNFDLVILDEVDAYPYRDSLLLHYAVLRAARPGGKTVYLTATPSAAMQKQARGQEMGLIYISARHHGFPVPEPQLIRENRLRYPGEASELELPSSIVELIYRTLAQDRMQLFIFVPSVRLVKLATEAVSGILMQADFRQIMPWWLEEDAKDEHSENKCAEDKPYVDKHTKNKPYADNKPVEVGWVQSSHAGDPQRDQKRRGFSQGEFPILVTTTILERGITIPRVNVLVLFADAEKIFDEGCLIQMSGRAGRTAAYPRGKVWLVGTQISPAMRSALSRIREMNRVARDLGYLIEEHN